MAIVPLCDKSKYPLKNDWVSVEEMTKIVGFSRTWVETHLKKSGYKAALRLNTRMGRLLWCYPSECLAWLRQEAENFRRAYPPIEQYVSLRQASVELGHTNHWILAMIAEHRLTKPQWRRNSHNQVMECISPRTLRRLWGCQVDYAPAGWYNTRQLSIMTGWSRDHIRSRLAEADVASVEHLAENGRPYPFYAPEAPEVLGIRSDYYPPAGENLTVRRIAFRVGRTQDWVYSWLEELTLTSTAQVMLDDSTRPREHYPPMVFRTLERISIRERLTKLPQGSRKVG